MSKFKSNQAFKKKLARRIMAIVLSGTMVMSNMSAYAAELAPETETEVVSEVEETATTETTADNAKEANSETENSVTESSLDAAEDIVPETTTEVKTEDVSETMLESEAEENTTTETETKSEEDKIETEESEVEEEKETKTSAEVDNKAKGLTYSLDFTDADKPTDGTAYSDGKVLKNYFTVKVKASGGAVTPYTSGYIRIKNNNRAALQFTTEETATVTLEVSSTGDSNTSYVSILKIEEDGEKETYLVSNSVSGGKEGTGVKTDPDRVDVLGGSSDKATIVYQLDGAGTYQIMAPKPTNGTTSDLQIYKITVKEDGEAAARCSWDQVMPPEIKTITSNDGKISVPVKGVVNPTGDGADYVAVDMYDTNDMTANPTPLATEKSDVNTEANTDEEHLTTLEFEPDASGDYYFVARLGRADEPDKSTSVSDAVSFTLPLKAPANLRVSETSTDSAISVKVTWDAVPEAKKYIVTVKEKGAAEGDEPAAEKTITVEENTVLETVIDTGLERGKTYTFSVIAERDNDTSDATVKELKIKELDAKTITYILDATGWEVGTKESGATQTEDIFTISYGTSGKIVSTTGDVTATSWTAVDADSVPEEYAPDLATLKGINFNGKYAASSNKLSSRYIEFTTTGTAQVKVFWSLSGDGARNLVIFKDKDTTSGKEIAKTSLTADTGKKANAYYSEFSLNEMGTYELTVDANISIYKVIVTMEEPPAEVEDYILDATGWEVGTKESGATQTEGIFTISYGTSGKIVSTTGDVTATSWTAVDADSVPEEYAPDLATLKGINFNGKYAASSNKLSSRYIEFTTTSEAQVKVFWSLSGDGARNLVIFKDKDTTSGKEIAKTSLTADTGKKANAYYSEFTLNEAGTYELTVDANISIYKVIVTMEKATTPPTPEGPTDWSEVADPTITVADYDDTYGARTGKFSITVNAVLSDDKTEEVIVHVYDMSGKEITKTVEENKKDQNGQDVIGSDGKVVKVKVEKPFIDAKKDKGAEHTFEYSPSYSSSYKFEAELTRAQTNEDGTVKRDEDGNILLLPTKKSKETESFIFTLPLKAPMIIDYVNLGEVEGSDPKSGSVELAWSTVDEATGYVVTAVDDNGNEVFNSGTLTSTTTTIEKGLEIGKTYTFGVIALRDYTGANGGTEESAKGTLDLKINEKADSFEQGKYVLDAGLLYDASQTSKANLVVKTGRYSVDQYAADTQPKTYVKANGKNLDGDGNEVTSAELDAAVTATLDILKSFEEKTYFTVMFGSSGQVNTDNRKIYPNSFVTSSRLELGNNGITSGTVPTSDAIKFKTSAPSRVDVYWRTNTAGNGVQIVDANGKQIGSKTSDSTNDTTNDGLLVTSFLIDDPGTYYLGQVNGKVRITRVVVYDGYEKKARPEWTTEDVEEGKTNVTAPVITSAVQEGGKIIVNATADIGSEKSADSVTVYMTYKDENGEEHGADVFFQTSTSEGNEHTFEFTPEASNTYYFTAKMAREGEATTIDSVDTDAEGNDVRKSVTFKLPLADTSIKSVTNKGLVEGSENLGKIEAVWAPVAEAVYKVAIEDSTGAVIYEKIEKANIVTIGEKEEENSGWKEGVEGLALNTKYTLKVTAVREKAADAEGNEPVYGEDDEWSKTAVYSFEITGKDSQTWNYANFGSRANRGLISKASQLPAGCGNDSLIDTDPDSPTKGKQLANVTADSQDMKRNDYKVLKSDENDNPTKVRVWSLGTYGKIQPASTDGVSFYYTTVDPSTYNFTLSADVHVDQWTLSNGQEGFGVAAFDQMGASPDDDSDASFEGGDVWNNSYMAIVTKTEYKWDDENKKVSNTGSAVSLKLGIESLAKTGVTADNIDEFKNNATVAAATSKYFKSVTKPLDTQMHDKSYDNLIGNLTNPGDATTISPSITDLRLEIELNDTGYFVSYTPITVDPETREVTSVGTKVTNKFYDRNALSKIDKDSVYAGFFAARNAMVTFSDIQFTTTPYDAANANPESKEVEYVKPSFSIVSATTSNSEEYLLTYDANWHGKLYVKDESGADISDKAVDLNTRKKDVSGNYYIQVDGTPEETDKAEIKVKLNSGNNTFQTTFEPDEEYDPYDGDPLTRLEDYETKTDLITVTHKKYGQEGQALYVAPLGKATGDGTKKNPLDIYTAVKYVQPGQTIYLMGEKYDLSKTIRIERGTDGTKDKMIHMVPDPDEGKRPVLDFHGACEGMVIAGDYWYFYGFDVTRSADRQDGIRVCGDYNTLDSINTYKNGNTGIQISRLLGSDTNINTDWPKYNTIKNCTSYLNADSGYEDADGFACKLTSGVGNKFIGCVAAYNADDGWDFYAKVETGKIGMVTIENCITYKNGYVLRADGGTGDLAWFGEAENVTEVSAGNGNGFKMGGSSLSGYHTLKNSLAFYNKSKGFDSNSCPDIQVYNSITFNNESYNIAFYTKGSTTDYAARGVVSYRTGKADDLKNKDLEDRIGELTGTAPNKVSNITTTQQKGMAKIFNNTNYFFNRYSGVSENATDFVQHYTTRGVETDLTCTHDGIVAEDWFVSVDFDGENGWFTKLKNESFADGTAHVADRNANGTINMGGFLQLTEKAGATGSGLPDLSESDSDDVVSKKPTDFDGVEETDGTIEKGDADDEIGDSIDSDDLNKKPGSAKDQVGLWFSIVNEDEIGYTGKALKPEIRVYYDNTLLTKKDYSVTYKNNVNAWLGDTETGTGKTIDTATGQKPAEVIEGVEYTYGSGVKVAPTIIVKGKGNYIGQAKDVYFEIQPVNLGNDAENRVSAPAITVLKANQALKPVITFTGKKLSEQKDYDCNISDLTATEKADTQLLKVTGKGNFVGKINIEVRTAPSDCDADNLVSGFKIGKIDPQYRKGYETDYTGKVTEYLQVTPLNPLAEKMITTKGGTEVKLYDPETNPDGVIISYVNNVEVGTATAIITGTGKYYGTKEVKFKIIAPPLATLVKEGNVQFIDTTKLAELVKADENASYDKTTQKITVADISAITFDFPTKEKPYVYMGKAVQWDNLAVAAQIGGGWYKLTANTDYTLTYSGNNRAGTASVNVKGKGNYSGALKQPFVIEAFDISKEENLKSLGGTFALNDDAATAKYFVEDRTPTEENADTVTSSTPKADAKSKNTINYGRMSTTLYYDKSGVKPTISLRINGNLMRAGKDYTISYKNNTKVTPENATEQQLASFTIKGKGALIGTITGTYRIEKRPFNDPTNRLQITATDVKLTSADKSTANGYVGKNNTKIVVKDAKGKALSLNKDYVIEKYEYVDNSTYKVLTEKNATDPITDNKSEVRIADKNIYHTVKVTLKGAGENYTDDTLSAYYRIAYGKNSIKSAKVEIIYDGDPANNPGLANKYFYYKEGGAVTLDETTLKVIFKDGADEKVLKWGTDYKVVSYSKNDKKGTGKLIIEGQGEYIDQKVISFKIGAQDFFWWTQPTAEPDQTENSVIIAQNFIWVMNEGLALVK